jgi:hypothetical protein
MIKKQISEILTLLEEVYHTNDELLWREIFYKTEKLVETTDKK